MSKEKGFVVIMPNQKPWKTRNSRSYWWGCNSK